MIKNSQSNQNALIFIQLFAVVHPFSHLLSQSPFSFFLQTNSHSLPWQKRNLTFLSSSNHKAVSHSSGEVSATGVFNVSNIKASWMFLDVLENSNSANVVSSSKDDLRSIFEFDETLNFSGLQVQLQIRLLNINYIANSIARIV